MNTICKYAGATALAGALALAAITPGQARDGRNTAAAIGFGAGALVGAAVAGSAYNSGYYYDSGYYGDAYAYEPGYAYAPGPAYYNDYAYAPRANYWARPRVLNRGQGPGCIQSPASHEYTSCD